MAMETQKQVRQNAEELSDFVSGVASWAAEARQRDEQLKREASQQSSQSSAPPVRFEPSRSSSVDQASQLRARGNELFQQKQLSSAKECYEHSIQLHHTAAAFANAGLACFKLNELANADAYCSSALSLDPAYLKALQRRASAREKLGNTRGAAEDADCAVLLSPKDAKLRSERQRLKKALEHSHSISLSQPPRILPVGEEARARERQRSHFRSSANDDSSTTLSNNAHEEEQLSGSEPAAVHSEDNAGAGTTVGEAAERARAKLRDARSTLTPTTTAELESVLLELEYDYDKQASLLRRLEPSNIPRLLAEGVSEKVLRITARACMLHLDLESEALPRLEAIQSAPRFPIAALFLSKRDTHDLKTALAAARERAGGDDRLLQRINAFAKLLKLK
jgi:tetratricopeptide (TPR) repeat protein